MRLIVHYEDRWLLAVEKPAGVHTAPLRAGEGGTLLEEVIARYPEVALLPGMKPVEPGLLHRLDRETSGLVLVARTPEAFASLRASFEGEAVEKSYLAVCRRLPDRTALCEPGGRLRIESRFAAYGPGRRRVRLVEPGVSAEGGEPRSLAGSGACGSPVRGAEPPLKGSANPATGSMARRLAKGASDRRYATEIEWLDAKGALVLVRARIAIGFRHQIRAHLAALGLPILGDRLYGESGQEESGDRLYLHAASITLPHPQDGRLLALQCPLPAEFLRLFPSSALG